MAAWATARAHGRLRPALAGPPLPAPDNRCPFAPVGTALPSILPDGLDRPAGRRRPDLMVFWFLLALAGLLDDRARERNDARLRDLVEASDAARRSTERLARQTQELAEKLERRSARSRESADEIRRLTSWADR